MRDIIWIIGEKIMIALDSLDQLIDQGVSHFLIDASGVLYTDEGVVLGAKDAIQKLQALNKSVFLVTNNTSLSPSGIQKYLAAKSIFLPEEDILSSGLGLRWDKEANSLIYGKRCYVYGWDGSRFYVEYAGGLCVDDIQEAEVVVVLASLDTDNKEEVSKIVSFLNDNPEASVICGNPDRYVMGLNGLFPVCGFYAEKINHRIHQEVHWIGKPHDNFSEGLKRYLKNERELDLDKKNACFFDDNLENVISLSAVLSISGALITDTGLFSDPSLQFKWEGGLTKCHYCLKKFSL